MLQRDYLVAIAFSIGFVAAILLATPFVSSVSVLITDVIITLISALGIGAAAFFWKGFWRKKTTNEPSREDRQKHSKQLYEDALRMLMYVRPKEARDRKVIFKVPTSFDKIQELRKLADFRSEPPLMDVEYLKHFDWALAHLNHHEYKRIKEAWEKANRFREECSVILKEQSLTKLFEEVAMAHMRKAYPDFVNNDELDDDIDKDSYSVKNIAEKLDDKYRWIRAGTEGIKVVKEPCNFGKQYRITLYGNQYNCKSKPSGVRKRKSTKYSW